MARWHPPGPWSRPEAARVLTDADVPAALAVCAQDPVGSVLAASRIVEATRLSQSGGQVWGFPAQGPLLAICWAGANLVPVVPLGGAEHAQALDAFAALARRFGRRASSIVGERAAALGLWDRLAQHWPAARDVRDDQPSLMIDRAPEVEPDPMVRRSVPAELPLVLPACVRMFVEEVGYSPVAAGGNAYAERVRGLITSGRSFVRLAGGVPAPSLPNGDRDPLAAVALPERTVAFKAELGAVTSAVAQVQGVWVDPQLRGRRLSESGMAAVVEITRREIAPVVSLYVNAYNERALATYRRVGFEQVGTFATVLF
ncbi:GNAT family N-acetyltransferase [Oerskovia enterophila]